MNSNWKPPTVDGRAVDSRSQTGIGPHRQVRGAREACAVAEEVLYLELEDPRLRSLITPHLSSNPAHVDGRMSPRTTTDERLTIRLRIRDQPEMPVPSGLCEQWTGRRPRFKVRLGEHLAAAIDVERSVIDGWLSMAFLNSAPGAAARLLVEAPLAAIRAAHGWQVIHAATVVGAAGAVVIRGCADSGKSTLAAAAWQAGLEVLGDESVLVRRTGHTEVVAAVREILIHPSTRDMLGIDAEPFTTPMGEAKYRVPLEAVLPQERRAHHLATVIIGDRDCRGGARLEPIGESEFLTGFAEGEIPQERWYRSPEPLIRTWVRRPTLRLDGAGDLEGAIALIERLARGGGS